MSNKHNPRRIIQISDTHCYADDTSPLAWSALTVYPNRSLQRVLAHLRDQAESFELLVISGDIVQEETAEAYQRVQQILQDFPTPIYLIPGNHDVPELLLSHLVTPTTGIHWQEQLSLGHWDLQLLNTHLSGHADGHLSAQQLEAIATQLELSNRHAQHTLLFMHHHPAPFGSGWMDQSGLQQSAAFLSLVQQHATVKAIAFGHIHHELHQRLPGGAQVELQLFGTPATCVQLSHDESRLGYAHSRPAWRELLLHDNGRIDSTVFYLDEPLE